MQLAVVRQPRRARLSQCGRHSWSSCSASYRRSCGRRGYYRLRSGCIRLYGGRAVEIEIRLRGDGLPFDDRLQWSALWRDLVA
jgi:hypothetical protein